MDHLFFIILGVKVDIGGSFMQKKILVVDDDYPTVELISLILEKENFMVLKAYSGKGALDKLENNDVDAALLDMMLPDINGLNLLQTIRNNPVTAHIPLIMVTGRTDEIDTVLGLEMGADDYIYKPFKRRELVARLNVIFRRIEQDKNIVEKNIIFGSICINVETHKVVKDDVDIIMSPKEFQLLTLLSSNPNKVYTREELLDKIWDDEIAIETRTVDVHIRRIRSKIEDDPENPKWIETVRGYGYRFSK